MVEAWWRSLKHQWLFLHPLDSIATIQRLVNVNVRRTPARGWRRELARRSQNAVENSCVSSRAQSISAESRSGGAGGLAVRGGGSAPHVDRKSDAIE